MKEKRISIDEWLDTRIGLLDAYEVPSCRYTPEYFEPTVDDERDAYIIIYERRGASYCSDKDWTPRHPVDVRYYDVMVAIKGLGFEARDLLKSSNPKELEYAKKTLAFLEDFINAFDGRLVEVNDYDEHGDYLYFKTCYLNISDWFMFKKGAKIIFKAFDQRFKARYKKEVAEEREQEKRKLTEQKEYKRARKKKKKTFIDKYRNK